VDRLSRHLEHEDLPRALRGGPPAVHRVAQQAAELQPRRPEPELPLADPRHVEEVVEQVRHVPDLAADHGTGSRGRFRASVVPLEDLERVHDGRERAAELVGQRREELVLAAVRVAERVLASARGPTRRS
jgi:hypothetical protein